MNKCIIYSAEKICKYYLAQYKNKRFVLRFIFFIHLSTSKVSVFRFITTYNEDFQIILDKLANTGNTLFFDLQLAVYLHGIKDIYLNFAALYWSVAQANVQNISAIIVELEDKAWSPNELTLIPARSLYASWEKSYNRGNKNTRNWEYGSYPNRQGRNLKNCLYCHASEYNKTNC